MITVLYNSLKNFSRIGMGMLRKRRDSEYGRNVGEKSGYSNSNRS